MVLPFESCSARFSCGSMCGSHPVVRRLYGMMRRYHAIDAPNHARQIAALPLREDSLSFIGALGAKPPLANMALRVLRLRVSHPVQHTQGLDHGSSSRQRLLAATVRGEHMSPHF